MEDGGGVLIYYYEYMELFGYVNNLFEHGFVVLRCLLFFAWFVSNVAFVVVSPLFFFLIFWFITALYF